VEIALAIPAGSLDYWRTRLSEHGAKVTGTEERRGERALVLDDPHGQHLALVETADRREAEAWTRVPCLPTVRLSACMQFGSGSATRRSLRHSSPRCSNSPTSAGQMAGTATAPARADRAST